MTTHIFESHSAFLRRSDPSVNGVSVEFAHGPGEMPGKLNGIGGKIEHGEDPGEAMARETREELGLDDLPWKLFTVMHGTDEETRPWVCYCYAAFVLALPKPLPSENDVGEIVHVGPRLRDPAAYMRNLAWLIPLARERAAMANVYYEPNARGDV